MLLPQKQLLDLSLPIPAAGCHPLAQQLTRSLSSRSSSGGAARATCCKSLHHRSSQERTASQPAAFAGLQCIPMGRSTCQQPCKACAQQQMSCGTAVMMRGVPEARALLRAASQVLQQPLLQHQEAHGACRGARASTQILRPQSKQDQGKPALFCRGRAAVGTGCEHAAAGNALSAATWRQLH